MMAGPAKRSAEDIISRRLTSAAASGALESLPRYSYGYTSTAKRPTDTGLGTLTKGPSKTSQGTLTQGPSKTCYAAREAKPIFLTSHPPEPEQPDDVPVGVGEELGAEEEVRHAAEHAVHLLPDEERADPSTLHPRVHRLAVLSNAAPHPRHPHLPDRSVSHGVGGTGSQRI